MKKNAIMMSDLALEAQRMEGMSSKKLNDAARTTRFWSIYDDAMAAMLGAVP